MEGNIEITTDKLDSPSDRFEAIIEGGNEVNNPPLRGSNNGETGVVITGVTTDLVSNSTADEKKQALEQINATSHFIERHQDSVESVIDDVDVGSIVEPQLLDVDEKFVDSNNLAASSTVKNSKEEIPFDAELAKQLMVEAGYSDQILFQNSKFYLIQMRTTEKLL